MQDLLLSMTVILVTYEPNIAHFARRRVVFKDGRIAADSGAALAQAAEG